MVFRITSLLIKVFILTLIAGLVLGILIYSVTHSENLTEQYLTWKIEHDFKQVDIAQINITEQKYTADNNFTFSGIFADFTIDDQRFVVEGEQIVLNNVSEMIKRKQIERVVVTGVSLDSKVLKAEDVQLELFLHFDQKKIDHITGNIDILLAQANNYVFNNMRTNIEIYDSYLECRDIQADFAQGTLNGSALLEYDSELVYDLDFLVTEVEIHEFQKSDKGIYSKLKGRVNGVVKVKVDSHELKSVYVSLMAKKGLSIRASIVRMMFNALDGLVQYLPKFDDFPNAALLLKNDSFILFETSNIQLEDVDSDSLLSSMKLKCSTCNLDLNLTTDINVEDGLKAFLNYAVKRTN